MPITKIAKSAKETTKKQIMKNMNEKLKGKPQHGQYPERVDREEIDKEVTYKWLQSLGLKLETKGLVIAALDQCLPTRYYQHKIISNGTDPKCRQCHEFDESIEHFISGCPALAKKEYLARHDKALIYIHWNI